MSNNQPYELKSSIEEYTTMNKNYKQSSANGALQLPTNRFDFLVRFVSRQNEQKKTITHRQFQCF